MTALRLLPGLLFTLLFLSQRSSAADPIAFVTEVKAPAQIEHADGQREPVRLGSPLLAGDQVLAGEAQVVLIHLSGLSTAVEKNAVYRVAEEAQPASPLVQRLMKTMSEVAGPQEGGLQPAVHGMARVLDAPSAVLPRPANTRLSAGEFSFSWGPRQGIREYQFILKDAQGRVLVRRAVQGLELSSKWVGLKPGQRYTWTVEGADVPESWLELAPGKETATLHRSLEEIGGQYPGATGKLLRSLALCEQGYYFEAERLLRELEGEAGMKEQVRPLLEALAARQSAGSTPAAPSGKNH